MGIEAAATLGADAAPLAEQQSAAEQVGPDFQAVVAPLIALRRMRASEAASANSGTGTGRAGRSSACLGMFPREM